MTQSINLVLPCTHTKPGKKEEEEEMEKIIKFWFAFKVKVEEQHK